MTCEVLQLRRPGGKPKCETLAFGAGPWKVAALPSVGIIVGSWVGKRTVEHLSPQRFRLVVGCLLVDLALQMIVFG